MSAPRVLLACPTNAKLFADLSAAAVTAQRHHPGMELDVLVGEKAVPAWYAQPGPWMRTLHRRDDLRAEYDLVIQLDPDEELASHLSGLKAPHRSGAVMDGNLMVKGRWSQTFLAQWASRRYAPFAPYDLFNRVLLGQAPLEPMKSVPAGRMWLVDLDSLPAQRRAWGEELLALVAAAHPGKARDGLSPAKLHPGSVEAYVGGDAALATWLASQGTRVVLAREGEFDSLLSLSRAHAWYVDLSQGCTPGAAMALIKGGVVSTPGAFQLTDEYLGGLTRPMAAEGPTRVSEVYDALHYVVLNYVNDLREVDLPIPQVTAQDLLHLKGTQAVFGKLIHLHQFGMKFLQEFLDKVSTGDPRTQDLDELGQKMGEVDDLADRTLAAFPELDVFRLGLKFAKSAAQGSNMVEVSKSMILVLHEANQAMLAYNELIDAIVRRHVRPTAATGA